MNFKELGLSKKLLDEIKTVGYTNPTPIQEKTIPLILNDNDVLGIAQTGSGKTAAYSLPIIQKLLEENINERRTRALIVSPTRELAIQIRDNIRSFSLNTNLKCSVVLGGVNQASQIKVLKKGVDIIVATPGRLVDMAKRNIADLSKVEYLVLDEADTMLDMGFIKDIKYIIAQTPKERQTMLFSATMPISVKDLANKFLTNPKNVKIESTEKNTPKIKQLLYYVDKNNKADLLLDLLSDRSIATALIFTRTKLGANKLSEHLEEFGIKCSVIHGDKTQQKRVKALNNFKKGKTNVMIATDIAARGIDISELSHVINYDMPEQAEIYVHRIGRTARAGLNGTAISLVSADEINELHEIEKLINKELEVVENTKYPMTEKIRNKKKTQVRRGKASIKDKASKPRGKKNYSKSSSKPKFDSKKDSRSKGKFDSKKDSKSKNKFDSKKSFSRNTKTNNKSKRNYK